MDHRGGLLRRGAGVTGDTRVASPGIMQRCCIELNQ